MSEPREDLPPWACLVGLLPAVVSFVLGLGFAVSFLTYIAITTAMIIIWQLEAILQALRQNNSRATRLRDKD